MTTDGTLRNSVRYSFGEYKAGVTAALHCGKKKQYKYPETANEELARLKKSNGFKVRGILEVYRCEYCKYWHIGNRRGK
jgi:hypothetical protein